ncbi:hypothetical protein AQUCO_00600056v1 [Aquilegia coerulea]|uniref:Glycosyltransferase n=1 Tax=Aquilegia coerulea TaxID=218851 RepID=A0A2G5ENB7_AQUCA|nr:hypothetical protein AQUCO_00600056v1 [Aquilegia coerulea]
MDTKKHRLRILMFPWLAHGHISPYLELAKNLSKKNFYVYFCSTPINLSSIKNQLDEKVFSSIQLVELHLPSLPNLPPHNHTTKSLPSHLMSTLKQAFDMAESSFSNLLRVLKPDLLIYDYIQPWAPAAASRENIPAIHFLLNSAASFSYFCDMCKNPSVIDQFPFSSIYLHEYEYNKIMEMFNSDSNKERCFPCFDASYNIILIKTFTEIEAKYIGYLSLQVGKEFVPVGPLIQETTSDCNENESNFIAWLNEKDHRSVVFVSFGTEYFMSKEEIEEIAYGLELSKVNFIWVIRFPDEEEKNEQVDEVLPQGFLKRIGNRGMVVKNWAPQPKILAHANVGGFVSHCGWSSVMEGIHYGIPIIAMPEHLDQPVNARLVVELGVGKEVMREKEKFMRKEVAKVVNEVVVGNEGEEVRMKARELSEIMRKKGGGEEIDMVVEKLVQISQLSKKNVV